jgi:aldehyde:ferredoxin oxidoreductase
VSTEQLNLVGRTYAGKVLSVDLTKKEIESESLDMEWAEEFIGGKGLGARYFYELQQPHANPFSPDNHLIFMTGPLTGTIASTMSRVAVITRSPLTGTFLDSYAGGYFPAELKFSGYDGIIIRGRAEEPVWISIKDGEAELHDASQIWGNDTFSTIDTILRELGETSRLPLEHAKIGAIGPAGENAVRFANICFDKHHFAGRGGAGAVMGSKNLKAITVRGTKGTAALSINRERTYSEFVRELIKSDIRENPKEEWALKYGTPVTVDSSNMGGLLPVKNFQSGVYPLADEINVEAMKRRILVKHLSTCFSCAIGCRNETEVREGSFKGLHGEGPEYETLALCGSNVNIGDMNLIAKFNQGCSMMGLDTISMGNVLGWAMELFERGILTGEDTNGLDLHFGNADAYLRMPEIIARRVGIGNILAEGVMRASEKIGKGSERYALHCKGLEYPGYDPRGSFGMALAYATSDRGACHERAWPVGQEAFGSLDPFTAKGKAEIVMKEHMLKSVRWSLTACDFYAVDEKMIARLLSLALQRKYTEANIMKIGRRIWTLIRLINVREGFSRKNDQIPPRISQDPLPEGPAKGRVVPRTDFERMLSEYYELFGWDNEGKPNKDTLQELGLSTLTNRPA